MIARPGRLVLASLCLLLAGGEAHAHGRSLSYSTWTFDEHGARVELRIKSIELTRRPPNHAQSRTLPRELTLARGERPCEPGEARRVRPAPEGWAVYQWRVRCTGSGPRTIRSELFRDVAGAHTHFVRVDPRDDGEGIRERVLVTDRDAAWTLDAAGGTGRARDSFAAYVALGVDHIGTGWDHLAFVLALLLLAASLREVAGLVTGFTIAHSLTLGLAVLGIVRPETDAVEVLIGFSIALAAAENAWLLAGRDRGIPSLATGALLAAAALATTGSGTLAPIAWIGLALFTACHFALLKGARRPVRLRAALAFTFGLVHGFGFAGVLMELQLPASQLVPALFGFNLGVEIGQLAVVAVSWPVLAMLAARARRARLALSEAASAAIFAFGVALVIGRNFF